MEWPDCHLRGLRDRHSTPLAVVWLAVHSHGERSTLHLAFDCSGVVSTSGAQATTRCHSELWNSHTALCQRSRQLKVHESSTCTSVAECLIPKRPKVDDARLQTSFMVFVWVCWKILALAGTVFFLNSVECLLIIDKF